MDRMPDIQFFDTLPEMQQGAADEIADLTHGLAQSDRKISIALSGGSTPRGIFTQLAEKSNPPLPWEQIHFFWGDERHVPPEHPESNYRMAEEALFSRVAVPAGNIHRIQAELDDPHLAAQLYEQELQSYFQMEADQYPIFDLVLLGMGPDGHTASLFPGTQALTETERMVAANWVGKLDAWRITLTAPVINRAARVIILAAGDGKSRALHAALQGPHEPQQLPIQLIQPVNGNLTWMVDRAAAKMLTTSL